MQTKSKQARDDRTKIARLIYLDAQAYIKMDDNNPAKEEIGRRLDRLYAFYGFIKNNM